MELAWKLARQAIGLKQAEMKPIVNDEEDEDKRRNRTMNPLSDKEPSILVPLLDLEDEEEFTEIWLNAKTTTSNEFHMKHDEKKADLPLKEQIPPEYHEFLDLFDEAKVARFPKSQVWDHQVGKSHCSV